ncbi:MAG: hypothetical protein AB1704_20360 [Pseudomonadota bacterium]
MSKKKKVVAVAAVLTVAASFVGAKVYAGMNPSCAQGEWKSVASNPKLTFCTKAVWLTPSQANH